MSYLDDLDDEERDEAEALGTAYLDELCGYRKRRSDSQRRNWEDAELRKAQAETAWDLGVSLPTGHPFAPVVDGKLAA